MRIEVEGRGEEVVGQCRADIYTSKFDKYLDVHSQFDSDHENRSKT